MNLGRCPVCHAHLDLEAIVQDDAGRELLALLAAIDAETARPLVGYIGLFRPEKQDLRNARALQLARDVLALAAPGPRLAAALIETVEAIRAKGPGAPLKNHNYLRRVLDNTPDAPAASQPAAPRRGAGSKTAAAFAALENLK